MPNINLIAQRREEKKKVERLTRQLFFALVGSICAFFLVALFISGRRLVMDTELRKADAEMETLRPKLERIAQIERDQDLLRPKVDTLQAARVDTLRWRAVLQVISQSIPSDTWLSGVTASGEGADTTLNLTGVSATQTLVGETMSRLQSHPLFDTVDLRFTQVAPSSPNDPTQRVTFDIGARLRPAPGNPEKPEENAETKSAHAGTDPFKRTGGYHG